MFFKQSSVSYRVKKSRIGKKLKHHTRLLFLIGVGLATIILTVIWGNIWGEQAQQSARERAEARQAEKQRNAEIPTWLPRQPDAIQAPYLGSVATLDAATSTAQALLTESTHALSVPLYVNGTPMYDSAIAQTLGKQQPGATDVILSRLFATILASDGYIAATFACNWQTASPADAGLRRTLRAYEGALIAEISESGANEVLLLGLDLSQETLPEVANFLRELRIDCPEAILGVGISCTAMLQASHVETVQTLLTWADFVALDLSDSATQSIRIEDDDEGNAVYATASSAQVLSLLNPAIVRYRMRLLLPTTMYENLEQLEESGYTNWQIIH